MNIFTKIKNDNKCPICSSLLSNRVKSLNRFDCYVCYLSAYFKNGKVNIVVSQLYYEDKNFDISVLVLSTGIRLTIESVQEYDGKQPILIIKKITDEQSLSIFEDDFAIVKRLIDLYFLS